MTKPTFINSFIIGVLSSSLLMLSGCQLIPKEDIQSTPIVTQKLEPKRLEKFGITGKIGFIGAEDGQSGSAFYAWGQENERFTIELQGAMGLGFTTISYNGTMATLENSGVGTLSAESPEELLLRATSWQAPISQLPYWISGYPAPSDDGQSLDSESRLATAKNGRWTASFTYADATATLPNKITAIYTDKNQLDATPANVNKVIMTIAHFE